MGNPLDMKKWENEGENGEMGEGWRWSKEGP